MSISNYFYEVGELKRIKRSGWWLAKVKDPESVADHSHRTSIIAFVLAKMENIDPYKLCSAAVFHDVIETRLSDMHKVTARYVDIDQKTEAKVIGEQLCNLPELISSELSKLFSLTTKEKEILHDADYLECAIQAKEYYEIGYKAALSWVDSIEKRLKTNSAKTIFSEMKKINSYDWYNGLKKIQ